jgi:hypothetical protein
MHEAASSRASPPLTTGVVAVLVALVAASIVLRWSLADFADWGIDEAANLWLGTELLAGNDVPTGLVSSRGVPNLAGAPLLAMPLSLLPDLLAVSRALSLLQLACLAVLGASLWRRGGSPVAVAGVLLLFPALMLASFSMWNQYLTIPLTALTLPLLLFLVDGSSEPRPRAAALVGCVLLLVMLPALHLAAFVDLAVGIGVLASILVLRPLAVSTVVLVPGLVMVAVLAAPLYLPWLGVVWPRVFTTGWWGLVALALACALVATAVLRPLRQSLQRGARASLESKMLSWAFCAAVVFCLSVSCVLPMLGAQPGRRLLDAVEPSGWVLLIAQAAMVLAATPIVGKMLWDCRHGRTLGELMERRFACRPGTAAVILGWATLLCAARLVAEPTLLSPHGRSDLLLPLTPALLAVVLVLGRPGRRRATSLISGVSVVVAITAFGWLAAFGVSDDYRDAFWQPPPPSVMREVVDWIAAVSGDGVDRGLIDLGYDLERGREWINEVACRPWTSWYSIGRPYDWLLRRRHGLTNIREGSCERLGGSGYQLGYRRDRDTPAHMDVVAVFGGIEIRRTRGDERGAGSTPR